MNWNWTGKPHNIDTLQIVNNPTVDQLLVIGEKLLSTQV